MNQKFKFQENDFVSFNMQAMQGKGFICGVSTISMPIIGCAYMVKVTEHNPPIDTDEYPFSCISVFENMLQKIS